MDEKWPTFYTKIVCIESTWHDYMINQQVATRNLGTVYTLKLQMFSILRQDSSTEEMKVPPNELLVRRSMARLRMSIRYRMKRHRIADEDGLRGSRCNRQ